MQRRSSASSQPAPSAATVNRRSFLGYGAVLIPAMGTAKARRSGDRLLTTRGDRLFVSAHVNGVPVEALLDSAAEASVAAPGFAARLALGTGAAVTAHGTGAAAFTARQVDHVRLEAAGVVVAEATIGVLDLTEIGQRLIGRPLDFILGREIFDQTRLTIDIAGNLIFPINKSRTPQGARLPLSDNRGAMSFPVEIESHDVQATFDLGNGTGVTVSQRFADAYLADGRPMGQIAGGGLGGAKTMRSLTLRSLTVGDRTFENVPARVDADQQGVDANVGVSVLRNFQITTDFAEHALWLEG